MAVETEPTSSTKTKDFYSPDTVKFVKDPSLPLKQPIGPKLPTTSRDDQIKVEKDEIPFCQRFKTYMYNKENKTFCERSCKNWMLIIAYGIMYIIFLSTYTLFFLYLSLLILKTTADFSLTDKTAMFTYSEHGIGLSATPTAVSDFPIITFRKGKADDYNKYVTALDNLLSKKRRKRDLGLGPCGENPYGYGDSPCIVVKINKQFKWSGKPLLQNSTESKIAPSQVQSWLKRDRMLWLHCSGYNSYDKEHIGRIRYFPDPPGFDPDMFPLKGEETSPLVALQVSNFTIGVSLAIECKLWYVNGPSSIDFILYVQPDYRPFSNRNNV